MVLKIAIIVVFVPNLNYHIGASIRMIPTGPDGAEVNATNQKGRYTYTV